MGKNNRGNVWRESAERNSDIREILSYLIHLLPETKLKQFNRWLDCYIYYKEHEKEFNYIFDLRTVSNHIKSKLMEEKYNGNRKG